jgi:ABC-type multidrug transport system fused ATPase/permease subunit
METLRELMARRTTLILAHDLRGLGFVDQVVRLDAGRIPASLAPAPADAG